MVRCVTGGAVVRWGPTCFTADCAVSAVVEERERVGRLRIGVVSVLVAVPVVLASCGREHDFPPTGPPSTPPEVVTSALPAPPGAITFAGWHWTPKTSDLPVGPGLNRFAGADTGNVAVDERGHLHLRISEIAGRWFSAEVIGTESLGYGTYTWEIEAPATPAEPNAVLGLFTWSDLPDQHHREIDIELSQFRRPDAGVAGQYVVQPFDRPGNLRQFSGTGFGEVVRVSFTWRPGEVTFNAPGADPATWTYSATDVPDSGGGVHPRMNLWLLGGDPPAVDAATEVVIRSFTYAPDARG
jgi:hypothetical protein